MIMYVCALLDKKVNAFLAPAFFRTKGEATRSFMDAVASNQNIKAHPEDYVFCYIGKWDDSSGLFFDGPNTPEILMSALDAVVVEGSVN